MTRNEIRGEDSWSGGGGRRRRRIISSILDQRDTEETRITHVALRLTSGSLPLRSRRLPLRLPFLSRCITLLPLAPLTRETDLLPSLFAAEE